MPDRVRITDVSPRDGLQNEPEPIPTAAKLALIDLLMRTGVDEIELTSFVSPSWIPQLADAAEVCAGVREMLDERCLSPSPSGRGPGRGARSDSFHYPKAEKTPGATRRARKLRKRATVPERILWSRLKADQLGGLRFRRQHPIGPYIVDFYCAAAHLVIELDGRSHDGIEALQHDLLRERFLQDQGITIIRFNNDDVLDRLQDVLTNIEKQIKAPLPSPPPEGEGVLTPVFSALVPNLKGFDRALAVHDGGLPLKISLFTAASETFNQNNTNCSIAHSIEHFAAIVPRALDAGMPIRFYVSCAIACPYEGQITPTQVSAVADQLLALVPRGAHDSATVELDLADTIGVAYPADISALLTGIDSDLAAKVTLHLHDTFGRAAQCVRTALELGVRSFDGAAGGLGGCPFASTPQARAPGNIATDTLIRAIHDAGFRTGVAAAALRQATSFARSITASAGSSPTPSVSGAGGSAS